MSFTSRRIRGGPDVQGPSRTRRLLTGLAVPLVRLFRFRHERLVEEQTVERRKGLLKRIFLILLTILVAFVLFAGVTKALVSLRIISIGSFLNIAGADLAEDDDGFTNILLLGQGDASHDGAGLTDTIMVASLDPDKTQSVTMLSIPRDLYMTKTELMGTGRINGLYSGYRSYLRYREDMEVEAASQGAMKELAKEIGAMLNMEIHYVVKVDFIGFIQAVDALGGVDIDVPYDIYDTEYPDFNYGYETFAIEAGPQHLDGETALKYARSRHTTSDFGRSARQQQILGALAAKAKELGILGSPGKITSLMRIITEHTETTMTFPQILGAAKMGRKIHTDRIITMQLNSGSSDGLYAQPGGFLYNPPREDFEGASVLLPTSGELPGEWSQLHALTELIFRNRTILIQNPQIYVLNAGARTQLAGLLGGELIRYGFTVENVENSSMEDQPDSWVSYRIPEDKNLAEFMGTLLQLEVRPEPTGLPIGETGQITIFLGENYKFKTLETLLLGE